MAIDTKPASPPWALLEAPSPVLRRPARNPLAGDPRVAPLSSYLGVADGTLSRLLDPDRPPADDEARVHAALVDKVLGDGFPCVGARSAFNRHGYRFGLYPQLGDARSAGAVCHDLYEFSREFEQPGDRFATFIAVFRAPDIQSELHYEQLLWQHLQQMHRIDAAHFAWSESVSSDPESPHFSFSIGERPFFVVGLNPCASRRARLSPWPMLVFNLHEQFERLRARNRYEPLKQAIRLRDLAYQGTINPVLTSFGERSETRQYSGRAVADDWKCPFSRLAPEQP